MADIQMCTRCVMDTTIPGTTFDRDGICNHCKEYDRIFALIPSSRETGELELAKVIEEVKEKGKNKRYDCIIGMSGGVDSTYVAYRVKQLGLRPLAVHLDNGWNSEVAVSNVEKTLNTLGIDLFTYVINWEEFKDLQLSFLKASVPHAEHPSDHAIVALMYKIAAKEGIQYIISGSNVATEAVAVRSATIGQRDWKYIQSIHKQFGSKRLKKYPHFSFLKLMYYKIVKKQKTVNILDYTKFVKSDVMHILQDRLGWKYYGGKHHESIYTRFFQAYILPRKFNIDKRKAHLSSLICSQQLTREQALVELNEELYSENKLLEDKQYVLKKLGITNEEFERLMNLPNKTFWDYPSYEKNSWYKKVLKLYFKLKPLLRM